MQLTMKTARAVALAAAMTIGGLAATPPPARAQAPMSATQPLGEQLATEMFGIIDLKTLLLKTMASESMFDTFARSRPEWEGMIKDALVEEFEHDRPVVMQIFGRQLDKIFTPAEMTAGIAIVRDPAFREAMRAAAEDRAINPRLEPSKATQKLMRSPAGSAFLDKMSNLPELPDEVAEEIAVELVPGAFRRFAEKAEAGEAARRAAAAR